MTGESESVATNIALIKQAVLSIDKRLDKINGKMDDYEDRLRDLEVWQGGEKVRAGIMGVVAAAAGWAGSFVGSLFK